MKHLVRCAVVVAAVVLVAAAGTIVVARWGPDPVAAMGLGSEDAFALDLHEREIPPRATPLRWTTRRTRLRFRHLPPGPTHVVAELVGHRAPVRVAVGGAIVAVLGAGDAAVETTVTVPRTGRMDVLIASEGFRAGDGRVLGTQLRRVGLHRDPVWFLPGLVWVLVVPGVVAAAGAVWVGWRRWGAFASGAFAIAIVVAATWARGAVHSPYAWECAIVVAVGSGLGALACRLFDRRGGGRPWPYVVALMSVGLVLVPATSPLMVSSDVTFQAHMLDRVARGDLQPTSVTQHAQAFTIPYGVAFFALLAPLRLMGLDAVELVRWGAALAGTVAPMGLCLCLLGRDRTLGVLSAALLLLIPGTFIVFSQGNLPNAFGQAMTVLFFAWWVGGARGWGWGLLSGALAGLAHLSSAIVLLILLALLAYRLRGRDREPVRSRLCAAGGVALVTIGYYAAFVPLVLTQLSRIGEGPQGMQHGSSAWHLAGLQAAQALHWWGGPAIALALLGSWRLPGDVLGRGLWAFWAAGGFLCVAALATPLEVRYLYALTVPLAMSAALGLVRLGKRGVGGRALGGALLATQAVLALAALADRVLHAYR